MFSADKIKHIIWDYNGTLLDDAPHCVQTMNGLLTGRNLPVLTLEKYKEVFDFPVKNYYRTIGFNFDEEPFEKIGLEFIEKYNDGITKLKLMHHAVKSLQKYKALGIQQYILSARNEKLLISELKHFRIEKYFDKIAGLNNHYANGKIEIAEKLLSEINSPPETCLLVGDTVHDCRVAEEIGIASVLLSSGHHSKKRLSQCDTLILNNLSELKKLFENS